VNDSRNARCNFGQFHKKGESLWFPSVWAETRADSGWPQHDERYLDRRFAHVEQENRKLAAIAAKKGSILVLGAGYIGVEWATDVKDFFPAIEVVLADMLPSCLGPLPESAKKYCQRYLDAKGIKTLYGVKVSPNEPESYITLGIAKPDATYVLSGFKASVWYLPRECLSSYNPQERDKQEKNITKRGPAGGGWIRCDEHLQVLKLDRNNTATVYGKDENGLGRIYAVGDCNMLNDVGSIPKIAYPAEEQAAQACRQILIADLRANEPERKWGCFMLPYRCGLVPCLCPLNLETAYWPFGAGIFAVSLGQSGGVVVFARQSPGSGCTFLRGCFASWFKWIVDRSKVDQCRGGVTGRVIWGPVH
jgi:NADH dehydrogenase FAD-containing subunit